MKMIEQLSELGIEGKRANVYLTLLRTGPASASEIAKLTNLKRPTVYDLLAELMESRLVSTSFSGTMKIFSAENPENIAAELKRKLASAEALMPDLKTLYEQTPQKPRVRYYEGVDGIKTVCEDILNVKSGEYHYFGSLHEMFLATGREYQNYYVEKRINRGIWSNAIRIREKEVDDEFMKSDPKYLRRVRFFPNPIGEEIISLFIYDNKIALHSGLKGAYAMIIESRELSALLREIWKCTWSVSKD
ncbi:MAG: helix-turn-helix domain-containing protein [Verrucomicrobiae bacterium]|nr:helix-turn-helix domain-containing protein [Verrucomicrobiae bacterium]